MKDTAFRSWLRQLWQENCVEREEFNERPYTQKEYFKTFRYWLKREFRHQNQ